MLKTTRKRHKCFFKLRISVKENCLYANWRLIIQFLIPRCYCRTVSLHLSSKANRSGKFKHRNGLQAPHDTGHKTGTKTATAGTFQ